MTVEDVLNFLLVPFPPDDLLKRSAKIQYYYGFNNLIKSFKFLADKLTLIETESIT